MNNWRVSAARSDAETRFDCRGEPGITGRSKDPGAKSRPPC
jgi:hypothetical protein